jgi:hypothetical protein
MSSSHPQRDNGAQYSRHNAQQSSSTVGSSCWVQGSPLPPLLVQVTLFLARKTPVSSMIFFNGYGTRRVSIGPTTKSKTTPACVVRSEDRMASKPFTLLSLAAISLLAGAMLAIDAQTARAQAAQEGPSTAGSPASSSAPVLFKQYCASCHGLDGTGDGPVA